MNGLTENAIEQMALEQLQNLGWQTAFGPGVAIGLLWVFSVQTSVPDVEKILEEAGI